MGAGGGLQRGWRSHLGGGGCINSPPRAHKTHSTATVHEKWHGTQGTRIVMAQQMFCQEDRLPKLFALGPMASDHGNASLV